MVLRFYIFFAALGLARLSNAAGPAVLHVESLATIPVGNAVSRLAVSDDAAHVLLCIKHDGIVELLLDGTLRATGQNISTVAISPKGEHFAYTDLADNQTVVFADATRIGAFDTVGEKDGLLPKLLLSNDGKHLAFIATRNKESFVVIDGKENPVHNLVDHLIISNDGLRTAYIVRENGSFHCVVDGVQSDEFQNVRDLCFSPDGHSVAFVAQDKDGWAVFLDGKRGETYSEISPVTFSPDSKRNAYGAAEVKPDGSWLLITDSKPAPFDFRILALACNETGEKWIARVAVPGPTVFGAGHWVETTGEEISINGKLDGHFYHERNIVASPDGSHFAYVGEMEKGVTVRRDFKDEDRYDSIGTPAYSPDSQHLAYPALSEGKWTIMLDGHGIPDYEPIQPSGTEVPICNFDKAGNLIFIATRESKLYRVTAQP